MTAREKRRAFIEAETALTQTEVALIIGCRARDVQNFIKPSFHINSRPKFRQADVLQARNKMIAVDTKRDNRNRAILQGI